MQNDLSAIEGLLACPQCHGELRCGEDAVRCSRCHALYPIQDGIALFVQCDTIDVDHTKPADQTSEAYQQNYQKDQSAATYNAKYRDRWTKRISTRREFGLLDRMLRNQGRSKVLLDLPCGGGRLSPPMARYADLLIEADVALGQLRYGRIHGRIPTRQVWMTASGFHIPLRDSSVDGTVCVRLNHHLPTEAEREQLVRELLRVSKRFLIMSFFDYYSPKNTLRRLRRPFNRKPSKSTMKIRELQRLARDCGATLVEYPAISLIGSGHRYALMVKDKA
ncbi:MAG: SAM-dependent methyltransferase [Deltaproteobacteria bacterium]|nr:SAM-dependent methyltransferase [Deltaproteobacteria bacterium]